jgi:DNA-binding NtrC family response regulator
MVLPDGSGLDVIHRVPSDHRGQIVFISGTNDPDQIRRAVATPASEFIGKPVCEETLHRLLERSYARFEERARHEARLSRTLLGESAEMRRVRQDIERAGPSQVNVLITGVTGTGKELVARALHEASNRPGNLVSVNCGAVPADLLASQMFGHERGSFTGAFARHLGWFEQAEGGTLFLDEIGDMPPALQVYLLRVLETQCITRVGGNQEIPVDVRVIAATHSAFGPGMRDDLYYRLARYVIALPPLRKRGSDVELLASSFVHRLDTGTAGPLRQLDPMCIPLLHRHPWPGNVRELAAAVEQAYLQGSGGRVFVQPQSPEPRGLDGR